MTKNDISNLILKKNRLSIINAGGLFYISSFCFNTREDVFTFYSHKKIDNSFICLTKENKYYIVVASFLTREDAEKALSVLEQDWYDNTFPRITYPTEMMFLRDWYDEDYIKEHHIEEFLYEEKLRRNIKR